MTDSDTPRDVTARRLVLLGTVATALAAPAAASEIQAHDTDTGRFLVAQAEGEGEGGGEGEGEGEGGGAALPADVALLRDLGFMTGHLRAGMALYDAGDLAAAKTHMGHPIEEKYDAVAGPLETLGMGGLRDDLMALSAAAEAEAPADEVRALFEAVLAGVETARNAAAANPRQQILALAALMRVAGDEYTVAVAGGDVSNLHEYQDSWGFLQTIRSEADAFAASDDAGVAEAGADIRTAVDATLARAFGDIQGGGIPEMDPSLLYAGAARVELAAYGVE